MKKSLFDTFYEILFVAIIGLLLLGGGLFWIGVISGKLCDKCPTTKTISYPHVPKQGDTFYIRYIDYSDSTWYASLLKH